MDLHVFPIPIDSTLNKALKTFCNTLSSKVVVSPLHSPVKGAQLLFPLSEEGNGDPEMLSSLTEIQDVGQCICQLLQFF